MPCWRGEAISQHVLDLDRRRLRHDGRCGRGHVVNKRVLEYVHPVPVNFFVRSVAIAGLLVITVPLTVLQLWPNGFGINAAASLDVAVSACVTWLVAFTAYYYALRAGQRRRRGADHQHRPAVDGLFACCSSVSRFGALHARRHGRHHAGVRAHHALDGGRRTAPMAGPGRSGARRRRCRADPTGRGVRRPAAPSSWSSLSPCSRRPAGASARCSSTMAEEAYGKPTPTMMLESQLLGMLMLGAVHRLAARPAVHAARSPRPPGAALIWLLLASGALEAGCSRCCSSS